MKNNHKIIILFLIVLNGFPIVTLSAQNNDTGSQWDNFLFRNWFMEWLLGEKSDQGSQNIYGDLIRKINLNSDWKFSIGDNLNWASPAYVDNKWERIRVPARWENEGFNGYDGYAWYRVHFDGRELNRRDAHILSPGFIDDVDETYLNGTLIGKSGAFPPRFRTAYNSDRSYFMPNELINFNGDNVIAIRVYDETLDGGIIGGNPGIYAQEQSDAVEQGFYGPWKFTTSNNPDCVRPDFNDTKWESVLVPNFWDNQGYRSYDGTAWYRKVFRLSFTPLKTQSYYLVLGKIDDFDVTYLNGQKIGETNDGRPFGESQSFSALRIYPIPAGLLNTTGNNVIAVKVTDIGKDGGIYQGPVGIVEASGITKILRSN
ncbi:MAG TPA: beta galactosidase jelly roll domain-containing protein [Saprospiraceae bacterium]|nr:beta galactosidase jelly roll domain-containing protein [Saprospiraceae bacterium]